MFNRLPRPAQNATLILACTVSAALAAIFFSSRPSRFIIPFVFIAVLVVVATRFGAMVGIVGSLLAGIIFAYLLYPPLHSVKVESAGDRSQLAWVVMAGIALSYLLAAPGPPTPHSKK